MTPAEIVAAWMEKKPLRKSPFIFSEMEQAFPDWWDWDDGQWKPHSKLRTLDALREVEARLSDEQWEAYLYRFATPIERSRHMWCWERGSVLLHASAEEKLNSLAQVLGPEVRT